MRNESTKDARKDDVSSPPIKAKARRSSRQLSSIISASYDGVLSGSNMEKIEVVKRKDRKRHYSEINPGKFELLSVDDDPINQARVMQKPDCFSQVYRFYFIDAHDPLSFLKRWLSRASWLLWDMLLLQQWMETKLWIYWNRENTFLIWFCWTCKCHTKVAMR